jgi:coenzyme F420-reducing hydrogenase beta subunit
MHTPAGLNCQHCGSATAVRRRQNTMYEDEESNFATLCVECQDEADEHWQDMWNDYYSSQGFHIRKEPPFAPRFSDAELEAFANVSEESFFA